MDYSNKTYPESIETIANSLGMDIPRDRESDKIYKERKTIQNSLNDAKDIFESQLKNSKKAINYLKERKITGETAKKFNIGYAENDFHSLSKNLGKKYSELNLLNSGLIVKKKIIHMINLGIELFFQYMMLVAILLLLEEESYQKIKINLLQNI